MSPLHLAREQALYSAHTGRQLPALQRDVAQLQEQLVTGLRVNRASDDPAAFGRARSLESIERRYSQFERSLGAAQSWANHTQHALDNLAELFMQASEEGVRALSDTYSAEDRAAVANRIDALLAEVGDVLNRTVSGEYLFGGNRTDQPPVDAAGNPTGDLSGERVRRITPQLELAVNIPGSRVLDTGEGFTITEALRDFADALRGTGAVPLQEAADRVARARDHVIDRGAEAGGIAYRLELAGEHLRDAQIITAGQRSELEDADVIDVASRLQRTQTALEAALHTTASTLRTSLLNYLR